MNKFTLILLCFSTTLVYGCATQNLESYQYVEVGRGEKSLLITHNSDVFFDFFLGIISMGVLSPREKSVTIESIDGVKVDTEILAANRHVLIEPGIRTITLKCYIGSDDERKEKSIVGYHNVAMEFKGGYTYETELEFKYGSDHCDSKIVLEKNRYNKSLNMDAAQFSVKPDKANVYVYRNETLGDAVKMDVVFDGKPIGQTVAHSYFAFEVAPGKHTLISKAENDSALDVDAEAGKNYFVWQEVKMGLQHARNKLQIVDDAIGKAGVSECKLIEAAK